MPLMIENLRAEFAHQLAERGATMDRAMSHIITLAYERGLDDGRRDQADYRHLVELCNSLLDPEMFGYAVSEEVRKAARRALGITR